MKGYCKLVVEVVEDIQPEDGCVRLKPDRAVEEIFNVLIQKNYPQVANATVTLVERNIVY